MLKGVQALLTKAGLKTLESEVTRERFGKFVLKIAKDEKVKGQLYESYLFRPAKRIFSFGLYSDEAEQRQK
jgi:hypothetical protein